MRPDTTNYWIRRADDTDEWVIVHPNGTEHARHNKWSQAASALIPLMDAHRTERIRQLREETLANLRTQVERITQS